MMERLGVTLATIAIVAFGVWTYAEYRNWSHEQEMTARCPEARRLLANTLPSDRQYIAGAEDVRRCDQGGF
ncbi:hypothetical protein GCM10011390_41630 [Aureimonas endophytica]|uniref:Uncharacterized protein n=1 Tax=Aureimonas endophytica TaxID=2027858 RepID=A0A917E9V2_9HYPH|nr:hypothetical protein [Aureimonas endophytica]GGE18117.1 hypothetical protein GCM10011390_41630 [Aureimonas endophytica]